MIDLQKTDGLWTVTLNRPDKANSLTEDMLARIAEIFTEAAAAPESLVSSSKSPHERWPMTKTAKVRSADRIGLVMLEKSSAKAVM